MAIYHLSVKHGSRKQGKSAAAHANYIAREGTYAQGRYVEDFVHAESWNMPDWSAQNAIDFWQAADAYERANGRLYTEIEIALPRELDQAQQLGLVRDFVSEQVGGEHPVTWAVHNRPALDGGMNPHAHIMLSERTLDGVERNPEVFFKRANAAHPEKGGAAKDPAWNHRDKVEQLRQAWEATANRVLQRAGSEVSLDHRSLQAQGIDRAPEPKLGPEHTAMLHRGELTEDAERVVELRQGRAQQAALERQMAMVETRVSRLARDAAGPQPGGVGAATPTEAPLAPHALQSQTAPPEPIQTAAEPETPASLVPPPPSSGHITAAEPALQTEAASPCAERGQDPDGEASPASRASKPSATAAALSPNPQPERLLPNDLPTLKSLWEAAYRLRLEQVKTQAQRIGHQVCGQLARHEAKRRAHQECEPQAPKGVLARWRQQGYERALSAWSQIDKALQTRWRQLRVRLSRVQDYGRVGTSPDVPSRGEQLAARQLQAECPELTLKLQQAQARQDSEERTANTRQEPPRSAVEVSGVHPYLQAKGVGAYGLRIDPDTGDLVIPVRNVEGEIRSLQMIDREGRARFYPGSEWRGNFHQIGERQAGEPILIAQAYASAASVHEATGRCVFVAFEASNLKRVAEGLRAKDPDAPMLICGDQDHHLGFGAKNMDRHWSEEAAQAVGGIAVTPSFLTQEREQGLRDFNDLYRSQGLERLKRRIEGPLKTLQDKKAQEQDTQREHKRERGRGMER